MINLKEETLKILKENGKTEKDILFVSDGEQYILGYDFLKIADFNYDNGYGGNIISLELKIVGDNWWMERHEYDGAEWWEFKTIPTNFELVRKLENFAILENDYYERKWAKLRETKK